MDDKRSTVLIIEYLKKLKNTYSDLRSLLICNGEIRCQLWEGHFVKVGEGRSWGGVPWGARRQCCQWHIQGRQLAHNSTEQSGQGCGRGPGPLYALRRAQSRCGSVAVLCPF